MYRSRRIGCARPTQLCEFNSTAITSCWVGTSTPLLLLELWSCISVLLMPQDNAMTFEPTWNKYILISLGYINLPLPEIYLYLRFTFTWDLPLPENYLYLRITFTWELLLPENYLYLRFTFTWNLPLPEIYLFYLRFTFTWNNLYLRFTFTWDSPLPEITFIWDLPLPEIYLCLRITFIWDLPLPEIYLCLRFTFTWAVIVLPCNGAVVRHFLHTSKVTACWETGGGRGSGL